MLKRKRRVRVSTTASENRDVRGLELRYAGWKYSVRRSVYDPVTRSPSLATDAPDSIDTEQLVQQVQTAFDAWLSGAEIDSLHMLQVGLMLGQFGRDNARLQRYCGIAWELAEKSAQPSR